MSFYTEAGELRSKAAHEVGHFLLARECGIGTELMTIDGELAKRESSRDSEGCCRMPGLWGAGVFDQVSIFRAGFIAAEMIGLPQRDGGAGDFKQVNKILANCTGDEHRTIVGRADRRVERVIRENFAEFERLVDELVAKRTIVFEQPAARATAPAPKPAAPIVQVRRELMPVMARSASVSSYNASDRSFDAVWSSGATVRRRDIDGEMYDEALDMTPAAVDLSRLASGHAPLLAQHDASSLAGVIGNVISARVENGMGTAKVRLSRRKELDGLAQDVADGIVHHLSVGYRIDKAERTFRPGDVPLLRATRWTPVELSLVAIPADPFAQVRKDAPKFEAMVTA